jgi:hypothetical protein
MAGFHYRTGYWFFYDVFIWPKRKGYARARLNSIRTWHIVYAQQDGSNALLAGCSDHFWNCYDYPVSDEIKNNR